MLKSQQLFFEVNFLQTRFEQFTVLTNRVSRNIRKIKQQEMAAYHLNGSHGSCLYYLYTVGDMTAAELCGYCKEDKGRISRCVELLEKEGYLVRLTPEHRYRSPLSLTEQGRAVGKTVAEKIAAVVAEIDSALTAEERAAFYDSFSKLSDRLDIVAANHTKKG